MRGVERVKRAKPVWKGRRDEWRGMLSFEGMQRLVSFWLSEMRIGLWCQLYSDVLLLLYSSDNSLLILINTTANHHCSDAYYKLHC